jgi:rhodanese-related sulfurtransferase
MRLAFLLFVSIVTFAASPTTAQEFPLRAKYPNVRPIGTEDLAKELGKSLVIDVRSGFEFSVMHIDGAQHIDVSATDFLAKLTAATHGDRSKSVVTYCNGTTCEKSYEAAQDALLHGFTAVRVYDAGILEWARMARGRTLLFGKPVSPDALISEAQYKAHLLDAVAFTAGAAGSNSLLIDVRDPQQRERTADFARQADQIPLDQIVKQLQTPAFRSRSEKKTLYIFDNVGKQVRWLQYALRANGYERYFFLKEGMTPLTAPRP